MRHCRALTDNAREAVLTAQLILQLLVLDALIDTANGFSQQVDETVFRDWPLEEEKGASSSGFDSSSNCPWATDDDDLWFGVQLLQASQQFDPVHVREGEIRKHDVRTPLLEDLRPIETTSRSTYVVTFWFDDRLEHSCHCALFVDSEHSAAAATRKGMSRTEQNTSGR